MKAEPYFAAGGCGAFRRAVGLPQRPDGRLWSWAAPDDDAIVRSFAAG